MKVYNKYHGDVPDGAINIMRPGPWGNPHPISPFYCYKCGAMHDRDGAIEAYEAGLTEADKQRIREAFKDVDGVVCCCAPRLCHGDVIVRIASSGLVENEDV